MVRSPVKLTTGRPSAAKAAKRLGVSKKVARRLSSLVKRSLSGFVMREDGRLPKATRSLRIGFRVVKTDVAVAPKKK